MPNRLWDADFWVYPLPPQGPDTGPNLSRNLR
jgi:hypothetical protein